MEKTHPTESFINRRYAIPILHQIRKAFPPSSIIADNGERRDQDVKSEFTTLKGKWVTFYSILTLGIVVSFIYGVARGSTGIIAYMVGATLLFFFGEMIYSRFLCEYLFQLSSREPMPASEPFNKNKVDYHETDSHIVAGHHFVSIAGVAPIVGPAQAIYFGWLPCVIWVILGSIFCGSPADMGSTILGARNNGKSVADISGATIHKRCGIIFLFMLVLLCWLIIAVFSNLIADLWITYPSSVLPVNIEILIAFGLYFLWKSFPSGRMHIISSLLVLVLLYVTIFFSVWLDSVTNQLFKFDSLCRNSVLDGATCSFGEQQLWTLWIGIYVTIMATIPVWWIVQPRDTINSHQLLVTMVLAILGIIIAGPKLTFPAVRSNLDPNVPIFPYLFVTIACGAISGFHSLVGSTNTSKQLKKMTTARSVGYSSMLMESCLALLSIVVITTTASVEDSFLSWGQAGADGMSNFVEGSAQYFNKLGIPLDPARTIVSVMVVSFAATTVDTCGRILRMLIVEFAEYVEWSTGCTDENNKFKARLNPIQTVIKILGVITRNPLVGSIFAMAPAILLCNTSVVNDLWTLFGATNQVVASLSLLTAGVYLVRLHDSFMKGVLYFLPFAFVTTACVYALCIQINTWMVAQLDPERTKFINWIVVLYAIYIMLITIWIIVEAVIWFGRFSFGKLSEYENSSFVKYESSTKRTGYFRMYYPIGYEIPVAEDTNVKSSSVDTKTKKTLFQRLVGEGGGKCC